MEQRSRLTPVTFDGPIGTTQHLRGLFDREAREIAQFDDPAEPLVQPRQAFQRLVERDEIRRSFWSGYQLEVFGDPRGTAATLTRRLAARIVDRQLPHGFGGD